MNLPILGTLSALFSDAGDEFKKLLEPWALVAAAVFLGLGLGFFYLPLRANSALLLAFEGWPTAWQVIVAAALLFALAYLINTLSGFFLALAGGRLLRDSPLLGRVLLRRQAARFDGLLARALADDGEGSARAFQRLAYEFPDRVALAPTALGNVRASAAAYSLHQYGAHLDTVWPLLSLTLAREDETLLGQLRAEQTATTFLATLAVGLAALGVAAVPVALVAAAWGRALLAAALWPVAYGLYRAAIVRALGWTRLIRAALDLYLNETGARLGLRPLADRPTEMRQRWEAVSRWLAYGGLRLGVAQVQSPSAEPAMEMATAEALPMSLTCPAGVAATVRVDSRPPVAFALLPWEQRLPAPAYEVTVMAAPEVGTAPVGGFVLVSDARLRFLPATTGTLYWPDGTKTTVTPLISRHEDAPDAYVWPLPGLAAHGSALLSYSVTPETALRPGPGVELLDVRPAPSAPESQLAVTVRYSIGVPGPAAISAAKLTAERVGETFQWALLSDGIPGPPGEAAVVYNPALHQATWTIPAAGLGDYFAVLTIDGHGMVGH